MRCVTISVLTSPNISITPRRCWSLTNRFLKKARISWRRTPVHGDGGRIENCMLACSSLTLRPRGRTLLDRELYLPEAWARDDARRAGAGVP